jgi:hypothetical protein
MIVVRVELWPGGDPSKAVRLGTATIVNDGSGTASRGNYFAAFGKRGSTFRDLKQKRPLRIGRVVNFPRKQQNAWQLLGLALYSAFGRKDSSK